VWFGIRVKEYSVRNSNVDALRTYLSDWRKLVSREQDILEPWILFEVHCKEIKLYGGEEPRSVGDVTVGRRR
jgi:hypothetical protein